MIIFYIVLSIIGAGIWLAWMTPKQRVAVALFLALPLSAQTLPKSYHAGGWGPTQSRHLDHFGAGVFIGGGAYAIAGVLGYGDPKSASWIKRTIKPWMHSVFWATVAGLVKENYDRKHGGRPEWGDAAYTGFGGFALGYTVRWGLKRHETFAQAPSGA